MEPRAPQDPEGLLQAWLDHLQVERAASPHTLAAYEGDVRAVLAAAGIDARRMHEPGALEALDATALLRWLRSERRADKAAASIARRLAAVRGFARFAVSLGALTDDPTAGTADGAAVGAPPQVALPQAGRAPARFARRRATAAGPRPRAARESVRNRCTGAGGLRLAPGGPSAGGSGHSLRRQGPQGALGPARRTCRRRAH